MRRVLVSKLAEGMVVAEDIHLNPNQVFIRSGTELTPSIITSLSRTNVVFIKVQDEENIEDLIDMDQIQKVSSSDEFITFRLRYSSTAKKLANIMEQIVHEDRIPDLKEFTRELWNLTEEKGQYYSILDYLLAMRDYDDTTYGHCLNVALFCSAFADWLHLSKEDREIAIISGLFHDIGKLKIPVDIIRKPEKLTISEYDEVKKHSVYGYEILSQSEFTETWGNHVRNVALMHHERMDGSGYPLGITGEKTDYFAKMVAIVDVFDAMTSARVYRTPICPFKVFAHFERIGYQKFDPHMLMTFLEHISGRYMNCNVRLNNGNVGRIVFLNKIKLSKPMIRCGEKYVDLDKESSLFIDSVF